MTNGTIAGYATTTTLNDGLASKQDAGDYALSSEIPDVSGFATTIALTDGLASKADASALSNYTSTLALTPLLDAKAPQSTTYSKTEVDTKLADYTLTADLPTGGDVDLSGYYTKTEADDKFLFTDAHGNLTIPGSFTAGETSCV